MTTQLQDLCQNCLNEQGCMDRGTYTMPKMYCEHFDVDRPMTNPWENQMDEQWLGAPVESDDAGAHRGLCANCANRHHCSIAKPEGDIWHCEEYR